MKQCYKLHCRLPITVPSLQFLCAVSIPKCPKMCDKESRVLAKMEVSVRNSKLKVFVADKLVRELKKNKIQAADVFEIVLVDDDVLLRFITCVYLKSRDVKTPKIANVLSAVYDKTMLLNVDAPKCVEVMEAYLVDYQYSREVNGGMETSLITVMTDEERLVIIKRCVTIILEHSKPADYYQCDDKFLFLLRTLWKHLNLLGPRVISLFPEINKSQSKILKKEKLKTADNIKYCLSIFDLTLLMPENALRLLINKSMIIKILTQFNDMLQKRTAPDDAFFSDLERDTSSIKHYIALTNIYEHIKVVEDIDVEDWRGPSAILRTLHNLGEFTKDTDATKSISAEMSAQLKTMHNSLLAECAQKLRNKLSHNYSFHRLRFLERQEKTDYKKIQQELKSLKQIFHSLFRLHLNQVMIQFSDTVYNCENSEQVRSLLQYIKKVEYVFWPDLKHNEHIIGTINELKNNLIPNLSSYNPGDELHSKINHALNFMQSCVKNANKCLHSTSYTSSFYELTVSMKYHSLENLKQFSKLIRHRFELFNSEYLTQFRFICFKLKRLLDEKMVFNAESTKTKIQENFECLSQIETLFQHLDDNKNNPIYEWENLKYLDELYSKVGVTEMELKGHEQYSKASDNLMKALKKNTSIFQIDKKFAALAEYFQSLDRNIANELEVLREAEKAEVQKILENKIIQLNKFATNESLSMRALEIQLLEVLEILNENNFKDNLQQLDERAPIPCGRNLRNSLGHFDMSFYVFTHGMESIYRCMQQNINALYKRKDQFKIFYNRNQTIEGAPIEKSNFNDELLMVDVQRQLYNAIKSMNFAAFQDAVNAGAVLQGRNHQNENVLDMCRRSNCKAFEQYERDKSVLPPSELEFIEHFLDVIPPYLLLNAVSHNDKVPKSEEDIYEKELASANGDIEELKKDTLAIACSTRSMRLEGEGMDEEYNFSVIELDFIKRLHKAIRPHLCINASVVENDEPKNILQQAEEAAKLKMEIVAVLRSTRSLEKVQECEEEFDIHSPFLESTLLGYAAFFGSKNITNVLLQMSISEKFELSYLFCKSLAIYNDISLFKLAITKCSYINTYFKNNFNHTILSLAIWGQCDLPIIEYLFEKGAKLNHRLSDGFSLLEFAVLQNRVDLLKYFIKEGLLDLNSRETTGSLLGLVCTYGLNNMVEVLLKSQIQIHDLSSCFLAATFPSFNEIVKLLLEYRSQEFLLLKRTELIDLITVAVWSKNFDLIDLFLQKITLTEPEYLKQLKESIFVKDIKIFEKISKYREVWNFSKSIKEMDKGSELLQYAVQMGCNEIVKKCIEELGYNYEGYTRQSGKRGITLLHAAACSPYPNYKVMQYLLTLKGWNVNAPDEINETALHDAVRNEKIGEASLLLKNGADVNARTDADDTLLHMACFSGNLEMVKMLVRFGAGPHIMVETKNGTPLDTARFMMNEHLYPYLETLQLQQERGETVV